MNERNKVGGLSLKQNGKMSEVEKTFAYHNQNPLNHQQHGRRVPGAAQGEKFKSLQSHITRASLPNSDLEIVYRGCLALG